MNTYIKKLQSKNKAVRKQILVGSLVACMSLVVFVWVYNFTDHYSNSTATNDTQNNLQPFKLFANSISSTYQNISASVGKMSSKDQTDTNKPKQIDLIVVEPKQSQ